LFTGSVFRLMEGHQWYNLLPMWVITAYRIMGAIPFVFNLF